LERIILSENTVNQISFSGANYIFGFFGRFVSGSFFL